MYCYNFNSVMDDSAVGDRHAGRRRYDFRTTFHKNPQLTTTYLQKAPIAQYVRRIEAQIAVRFCAMCSIYIMSKALGDIGCFFLFAKLVCAAILLRVYIPTLHRGKMAKWRRTQGKLGE